MRRKKAAKKRRVVAVSGGFDPLHIGHVRMFEAARKLGDKLVVILNNDNWLKRKKGFAFMPEKERKELIEALPFVDKVVITDHKKKDADRSVVHTLKSVRPDIFANGGDRKPSGDPIPEVAACEEMGIKVVYNVGHGGKVQSSSWMIRDAARHTARSVRPWGEFYGWDAGEKWYVKTIYVRPKGKLSLQYHHNRSELWVLVAGDAVATFGKRGGKLARVTLSLGKLFAVPKGYVHRLESKRGAIIVEVALGSSFNEEDIVRLDDVYGRSKV